MRFIPQLARSPRDELLQWRHRQSVWVLSHQFSTEPLANPACCLGMARVLIVGDSDSERTLLCSAIQDAGHTADCASTQQEAEQLLSGVLFDLVICKMVLPDGSGLQLAVKAADLGMSTMVMCDHSGSLEITTIAGVTRLEKPYGVAEFRKLIDDHLGA